MKRSLYVLFLLGLLLPAGLPAQDSTQIVPVDFDQFVRFLVKNHPLGKSATLRNDQAKAQILAGNGVFDPEIVASYSEKDFDGKDYYALTNSYVKWQTPLALQLKAGFEHNSGIYVDPENQTPGGGLWFAGASVPLLQGLLMDDARGTAALARIGRESLLNERRILLNNLAFQAALDYWSWYEDALDVEVDREGLQLAKDRFLFIRRGFQSGDRPAIDTLEAFVQIQQRELMFAERYILLQKSQAIISAWLRAANDSLAIEGKRFYRPSADRMLVENISPDVFKPNLIDNHPEIRLYGFKQDALKIEQRIKNEKLKPKLNLEYTLMNGDPQEIPVQGQQSGRKVGVDFKMPLFLRTARGDVQMNRLKLRDNDFMTENKRQELRAKMEAYLAESSRLSEQVNEFRKAVENYRMLLNAERTRFDNGESSVFLVNTRETAYLEARRKFNQLVAKYYKSRAGLNWSLGQFPE